VTRGELGVGGGGGGHTHGSNSRMKSENFEKNAKSERDSGAAAGCAGVNVAEIPTKFLNVT